MPPKKVEKKVDKGQQKALEKQKQKIAEDKTFGLKNKNKSKAVQKYIKGVQSAVKGQHNVSEQAILAKEHQQKEEKKKQLQQAALLASLFKGTENVKKIADSDARKLDPAAIKADQRIDLYTDQRDQKKTDTMADWDQAKLEEVIKTKHGASQAKPTEIVCKHFLDALERRQYGWFWQCPNGGDACKYRHCLPPGYVLRRDAPADAADADDAEPLEELIERERRALPAGGTKVTLETFKAWKEKKERERLAAIEANQKSDTKKGVLSGRDLFTFDPNLFVDDMAAAGEDDYQEDEAYWTEIINQNQATLDAANTQQQPSNSSDAEDSESDEKAANDNGAGGSSSSKQVYVGREELFLEDTVPNLDELDD